MIPEIQDTSEEKSSSDDSDTTNSDTDFEPPTQSDSSESFESEDTDTSDISQNSENDVSKDASGDSFRSDSQEFFVGEEDFITITIRKRHMCDFFCTLDRKWIAYDRPNESNPESVCHTSFRFGTVLEDNKIIWNSVQVSSLFSLSDDISDVIKTKISEKIRGEDLTPILEELDENIQKITMNRRIPCDKNDMWTNDHISVWDILNKNTDAYKDITITQNENLWNVVFIHNASGKEYRYMYQPIEPFTLFFDMIYPCVCRFRSEQEEKTSKSKFINSADYVSFQEKITKIQVNESGSTIRLTLDEI